MHRGDTPTATATAPPEAVVVVGERALWRGLLAVVVVLNVANAATLLVGADDSGRWLLLALERNPSTWFSSGLLALAAALAWAVGQGRGDRREWTWAAGLLGLLSLDEVATVHEKLGGVPGLPSLGGRAWAAVGLLLAGAVGARLLPWAWRLERHLRAALLLGGATYVAGAVGVEALAGAWQDGHGQDAAFWWISTLEEDVELLGVLVVVRILLAHLRGAGRRLSLSVGP